MLCLTAAVLFVCLTAQNSFTSLDAFSVGLTVITDFMTRYTLPTTNGSIINSDAPTQHLGAFSIDYHSNAEHVSLSVADVRLDAHLALRQVDGVNVSRGLAAAMLSSRLSAVQATLTTGAPTTTSLTTTTTSTDVSGAPVTATTPPPLPVDEVPYLSCWAGDADCVCASPCSRCLVARNGSHIPSSGCMRCAAPLVLYAGQCQTSCPTGFSAMAGRCLEPLPAYTSNGTRNCDATYKMWRNDQPLFAETITQEADVLVTLFYTSESADQIVTAIVGRSNCPHPPPRQWRQRCVSGATVYPIDIRYYEGDGALSFSESIAVEGEWC